MYCQSEREISALPVHASCSTQSRLAAAVFGAEPQPRSGFLFLVDAAGVLHLATGRHGNEAQRGVAVSGQREQVLDAWVDLRSAAPGRADLVLVLCRDCAAEQAKAAVRAAGGSSAVDENPVILRRPLQIVESNP